MSAGRLLDVGKQKPPVNTSGFCCTRLQFDVTAGEQWPSHAPMRSYPTQVDLVLDLGTFWERKQIVIPVAIGMGLKKWGPTILGVYHPHIRPFGSFWIKNVKSVRLLFNALNHFFSCPHPVTCGLVSHMRNMLMGTKSIRFPDTRNLTVSHSIAVVNC